MPNYYAYKSVYFIIFHLSTMYPRSILLTVVGKSALCLQSQYFFSLMALVAHKLVIM